MARYDKIYETLATRAVKQSTIDAETFLAKAKAAGMSQAAVEERLIYDLQTGGPIFGKFLRSLSGAATAATLSAEAQGEDVGRAYAQELIDLTEMEDVLDDAQPADMEEISQELSDRVPYTWVAELKNTCERCLPLHGSSQLMVHWREAGLHPDTIHDGWDEPCHCALVPDDMIEERSDLIAPLVRERVKSDSGLVGSKKTQRAIAQRDIDKSIAAVERAKNSLVGRRTLRLMGQVNKGQGSEE